MLQPTTASQPSQHTQLYSTLATTLFTVNARLPTTDPKLVQTQYPVASLPCFRHHRQYWNSYSFSSSEHHQMKIPSNMYKLFYSHAPFFPSGKMPPLFFNETLCLLIINSKINGLFLYSFSFLFI